MSSAPLPPVFDGHNDTLLDLLTGRGGAQSFFRRSGSGHIDLPRAREGGLAGGLFACWAPPDPRQGWTEEAALRPRNGGYRVLPSPALDPAYALDYARRLMEVLRGLSEHPGVRLARTVPEIRASMRDGDLAAVAHFEGAENLGPVWGEALEEFYGAGLRSLGLVWSRPNLFASGVPFAFPGHPDTGEGLTDAGRELVGECNRLGVAIDLSHINERGFWDVAALTDAPLIASHSNAHALCPTTRNLTDRQLDAIRDSGGIVGVNFAVAFLREDGAEEARTPLEAIVRHIDYLVGRVGPGGVGFGSDFDGAVVPRDLGDVSGLPRLLGLLREGGYDEPTLRGLAHENWLRVLEETGKG